MISNVTLNVPVEAVLAIIAVIAIGIGIKCRKYVFKAAQTFLGLAIMAVLVFLAITAVNNIRTNHAALPGQWSTLLTQVQTAEKEEKLLVIKVFTDEKAANEPTLLKRGRDRILDALADEEQKAKAKNLLAKFLAQPEIPSK